MTKRNYLTTVAAVFVIAWMLLWFVPLQVFRCGFVFCAFCGWGPEAAKGLWGDTR